MTHPPRITDDFVLTRWMTMEIGKINEGLVRDRKSLAVLIREKTPGSVTKSGEPYFFDRNIITLLGQQVPEELHGRLRLPVLFFMSPDVPDSCWCMDPVAFEVLVLLGEISAMRTMQDGKFWVSRAIAYAIQRKYPTMIQLVMGP
jgi:uncharacterized protein (UPF0216 family)